MILVEILLASCMYVETSHSKMTCHRSHSVWWNRDIIVSFFPDPGDHYIGPTCWIRNDRNQRTLIAETCEDFKKRLK